jgi:hypothetical protein
MQKMHIAFFVNLLFVKNILDVPRYDGLVPLEQFNHLALVQPNSLSLKGNAQRHGFIRAFKQNKLFLFHNKLLVKRIAKL